GSFHREVRLEGASTAVTPGHPQSLYGFSKSHSYQGLASLISLQNFHINIPKLHAIGVALQADATGRPQDAGMFFGMVLIIVQIGIDDLFAVQLDRDLPAFGGDMI